MSAPKFDIQQLTPEQRLALAEELWESLDSANLPLTPATAAEVERRERAHDAHPHRGRPWREVLDQIESRRG